MLCSFSDPKEDAPDRADRERSPTDVPGSGPAGTLGASHSDTAGRLFTRLLRCGGGQSCVRT
jgi:hypothetical protein